MVGISKETCNSLNFYSYLCQRIGSEEDVRVRRLTFVIVDNGNKSCITSGSRGEGLNLNGSDLDVMFIERWAQVYELEADVVIEGKGTPLMMYTEDTPPCFTQLYLLTRHKNKTLTSVSVSIRNMLESNHLGYAISSELYKLSHKSITSWCTTIHGPCLSDNSEKFDMAYCFKSDTWICQAKPWVSRPRTSWPSPTLISEIISCGVLFVPIGCKGSLNENLQWRISFSVAEKVLIFSFSHTQFVCYAMLKLLLKEIIEKHEDLKGLLCSYFLKTLMFWILEETDPYLWRPDNLIPCFMACLHRLLYCVRYSILSHYFISDNNLFLLRFNTYNKQTLTTILENLYEQGINCFSFSKTLKDYHYQSNEFIEPIISKNIRFLRNFMPVYLHVLTSGRVRHLSRMLFNFLHHSRSGLSKRLFTLQISAAFKIVPKATKYPFESTNKAHYLVYKRDLSHFLIGLQADAVSGWLMLASFFYAAKNYLASLTVLRYALGKYADETIYLVRGLNVTIGDIKQHVVNLINKETFHTILKACTARAFHVEHNSAIVPQELHQYVARYPEEYPEELQQDVVGYYTLFHPLPFAHFLSFLCSYHLLDIHSCRQSLRQLQHVKRTFCSRDDLFSTVKLCGIAHKLFDDIQYASNAFLKKK